MRYVYSVVRFVPDPARGEMVNLAVLAGSDESSEWELRRVDNLKRARAIDDRGLLPNVVANVERLAREIEDYVAAVDENRTPKSQLSEAWLRTLAVHSRNAIQFTEPLPLLADDLEAAVVMATKGRVSGDPRVDDAPGQTGVPDRFSYGLTLKSEDFTARRPIARPAADFIVDPAK